MTDNGGRLATFPRFTIVNRPLERVDDLEQVGDKRQRHRMRQELVPEHLGVTREQASGREERLGAFCFMRTLSRNLGIDSSEDGVPLEANIRR